MKDNVLELIETEVKAMRKDVKEIRQRIIQLEQNNELGNMDGLADVIDAPDLRKVLRIGDRSLYDLRQQEVFNTYSFKETGGAKPSKIYFLKSEVLASLKKGKLG